MNFLKTLLKKILNQNIYDKLKNILFFYKKSKEIILNFFYFSKNDYNFNENFFYQNNFNIPEIKKKLNINGLDYYDCNLSWHYHLFAALSQTFHKIKILEIGTYDGTFANFLSKIFPGSKIFTLDLPDNNEKYLNSYNRQNKFVFDEIKKKRTKNIDNDNINFFQISSNNITKQFCNEKFDLVWIDGDHLNPQVSNDILNCIKLINPNSIICCDDIVMKKYRSKYISDDSYKLLNILEKQHKVRNWYVVKRIRFSNIFLKKFISYSIKL
jgi:predicted O-methyltransferase YrrM